MRDYSSINNIFVPERVDLFYNKVSGWRKNVNTTVTNTYVPPPVTTVHTSMQPTYGYRFNYIPPEQYYHPDIFASRVGEHGYLRGHHY